MNLLLAPHNDDEALFASYLIQRIKPLVAIVTDAYIHQEKFGIKYMTRREESQKACKILGVTPMFMKIPDNEITLEILTDRFYKTCHYRKIDIVFAPKKQGGNKDHDLVCEAANLIWKGKVLYYSTYEKNDLKPKGEMALIPTPEEDRIKRDALSCYVSQLGINKVHFEAVIGQPEYLNLC